MVPVVLLRQYVFHSIALMENNKLKQNKNVIRFILFILSPHENHIYLPFTCVVGFDVFVALGTHGRHAGTSATQRLTKSKAEKEQSQHPGLSRFLTEKFINVN